MATSRQTAKRDDYLFALLAVGLGLLLRGPTWSVLSTKFPFLTFVPAVMWSAWRGGLGPGLFSTGLSALTAFLFLIEPWGNTRTAEWGDWIAVLVFVLVGAFLSWTTEQMRNAQQAEKRARLLSQQTLAGVGDGLISTDTDGLVTFMNATAEKLTGWVLSEAEGEPLERVFCIVNEETRTKVANPAAKALQDGLVQGLANHTILLARDGREVPIDDSGAPIRDEQGTIIGAVLVFRDISERRASERAIRQSQQRLQTTLESITDAFVALDPEGNFVYVNQAAERILRRTREDLLGKNHWEEFSAARGTIIETSYRQAIAEQRAVRFENYYAPLSAWLEVNAFPTPEGGLSIYFRNITEKKTAEERQRESEARLKAVLDSVPVGIVMAELPSGRISLGNRQIESILRHPVLHTEGIEQYNQWPLLDAAGQLIPGEQYPIARALRTGEPATGEFQYRRGDGTLAWIDVSSAAVRDGAKDVLGAVVAVADITDRKRMEQELAASKERLSQIFEQAPVAIVVFRGNDYVVELANPSYQALLQGRNLIGRRFADVVPELDQEVWNAFETVMQTGQPFVRDEFYVPYDRDGDGAVEDHWFNVVYHPFREVDGTVSGMVAVCNEVTTQVLARKELERVNRELEEFAYVASHDLQEPLRMVNIYSHLLVKKFGSGSEAAEEYASFIRQGVTRMETLIRDLLSYSRTVQRDELPVGTADLSTALSEALTVLQNRIEENSAVILAEPLPSVRGDTRQLAQVFQNLISNALKYRKQNVPPEIHISAKQQGNQWLISVRDNGIGFEQKFAERIFGLFKRLHGEAYPGTGLGLAICQRIIERYGGRMWAESEPEVGSTFYFALPSREMP